ncbi:MAG: hypothetical protein RLZZ254_1058 [Actinomycetota bacterium]|jgi:hypothetical protein
MSIFALLAAIATAGMCSYGLLYPDRVTRQGAFGLRIDTPIAMSEMRATYGAMAAIAIAVLATQSETVAMVLGIAWLGSFVGRLLSVLVDKSWSNHVAVSGTADLVMFVFLVPLA